MNPEEVAVSSAEIVSGVFAIAVALLSGLVALLSAALSAYATIKSKSLDSQLANQRNDLDERIANQRRQFERDLEEYKLRISVYDQKLLEIRLMQYPKLWRLTEQASRFRVPDLNDERRKILSDSMTLWYYEHGGMILSSKARNAFLKSREILLPPTHRMPDGSALALPENPAANQIVETFSSLRTALCEDLNSRRAPMADDDDDKLDPENEQRAIMADKAREAEAHAD